MSTCKLLACWHVGMFFLHLQTQAAIDSSGTAVCTFSVASFPFVPFHASKASRTLMLCSSNGGINLPFRDGVAKLWPTKVPGGVQKAGFSSIRGSPRRRKIVSQLADQLLSPGNYKKRVADFYNARSYGYDGEGTFHTDLAEHLIFLASLSPGMRVLDVACGTGNVTIPAAQAVGPGGEVVGVDIAADMLAQVSLNHHLQDA
jgi:Methyltransferase domain